MFETAGRLDSPAAVANDSAGDHQVAPAALMVFHSGRAAAHPGSRFWSAGRSPPARRRRRTNSPKKAHGMRPAMRLGRAENALLREGQSVACYRRDRAESRHAGARDVTDAAPPPPCRDLLTSACDACPHHTARVDRIAHPRPIAASHAIQLTIARLIIYHSIPDVNSPDPSLRFVCRITVSFGDPSTPITHVRRPTHVIDECRVERRPDNSPDYRNQLQRFSLCHLDS